MHADRTNRFMLTLLGLVLVAAGGAAMAASTGVFGTSYSHLNLFENNVSGYFSHHGDWLWPAIAVGCLLAGLACLRWLLALLASTDRAGDITIRDGSAEGGATVLRPQALIDALATEVSTYRGVGSASGRVIGDGRNPEIVLAVTTEPSADLQALHQRIEAEALTHARQAAGNPSLPVQLNLNLPPTPRCWAFLEQRLRNRLNLREQETIKRLAILAISLTMVVFLATGCKSSRHWASARSIATSTSRTRPGRSGSGRMAG